MDSQIFRGLSLHGSTGRRFLWDELLLSANTNMAGSESDEDSGRTEQNTVWMTVVLHEGTAPEIQRDG